MIGRAGLILCALVGAGPLMAGPAEVIGSCLEQSDLAFAGTAGAGFQDRWAALPQIAAQESACLTGAVTDCAHARGAGGCFAAHRGALEGAVAQALAAMPPPEKVAGRLAQPYADWHDISRRMADDPEGGAGPCPLPDALRSDGCPALAAADLLIRARDWRRILDLVEGME